MKDGVLPLLAALLLAVPVSGLAESDRPSNKWRISVNHNADSDGVIVFSVTPEGGSATQVSVNVPNGTKENDIAGLIHDAFEAGIPNDAYNVGKEDGEDVTIKRKKGEENFSLVVVSNGVEGVKIKLDRE